MIRVLLADDQAPLRAALRTLIDSEPGMRVVDEAADGSEAVRLAQRGGIDLVVMDVRMPVMDGLAATRLITSVDTAHPDGAAPRILILTTFDLDEYVFAALQAGASGFTLKSRPPDELLDAIRIVAAGEALLAPTVTRRLIAHYALGAAHPPIRALPADLTPRELDVLGLVARGRSNQEIALGLHISIATTKTHINRLLAKAGARDRAQLVIFAYETGVAGRRAESRPVPYSR